MGEIVKQGFAIDGRSCRGCVRGVTGARRVDDLTVDVLLAAPDAVLPE